MNDLFSLAGKNILITGSAQGIGFLLATGLGKYGAQIIINDITAERAELAVEKLHQEGIQAVAAPFNVTHKHEIDAAVEHIEKDIGPIDVLVNNAGIQRRHPFTEFPEQEWNDVIAVNQTAVFLVSQAVTRHMVERKAGKVINICSMQSELGRDTMKRPGFPGECFICELRLPDHRFRWKHNKLFLLLPEEYGPAFPAIVDCYTTPPT